MRILTFLSYLIYYKSEHYVQVPVANVKTTNKLGETRPNLYDKGAIIKVGDSFCAWENASGVRECCVRP